MTGLTAALAVYHLFGSGLPSTQQRISMCISQHNPHMWHHEGMEKTRTRLSLQLWNSWRDIEERGKNCEGRPVRGDQRGENCEGRTARVRGEGER